MTFCRQMQLLHFLFLSLSLFLLLFVLPLFQTKVCPSICRHVVSLSIFYFSRLFAGRLTLTIKTLLISAARNADRQALGEGSFGLFLLSFLFLQLLYFVSFRRHYFLNQKPHNKMLNHTTDGTF
jgi:hypothetical protein